MDFVGTLARIAAFLDEDGQRYALIGGLALAAYGNVRSTLDLDLAVDGDAQDGLIRFMESLGFETLYRSSGYSNHLHTDEAMGRVDFVFVRGDTADSLFDEANTVEGPDGLEVRVPRPEHLVAMKVMAMKNDPGRTFQELADIRGLMSQPDVDRDEIRRTFEKHGLLERFLDLEETL